VSTITPPTAQQQYPPPSGQLSRAPRRRLQRSWLLFRHPLTAICAVQAALSLTLVWSNTAYIDEADYLWVGHLEIAHWLYGASWPSAYAYRLLSGSPLIYPPVGALADGIGGLAGARILSLAFMLGATMLLYLTAGRLIGRREAIVASALWALSEPVIRLAFATFDPLSVLLTALSAWLIVQAGCRRGRGALVTTAAVTLALANMTAYSGIVIDPVVVAFAFLVWLPRMRARQALAMTAWLVGVGGLLFSSLMTALHAWTGLLFTVVARNIADYQSIQAILNEILGYSGLIMGLGVVGGIAAIGTEKRMRAALIVLLSLAAFIVPAAQLHDQTAWSIDKHLAYGIWFAAIASGYGCSKFIQRSCVANKTLTALCCVVILLYLAGNSWQLAWQRYHAWPNGSAFAAAFKPLIAQARGAIYVPGHEANIAEYYVPQGREWMRWSAALSLNPATTPGEGLEAYYTNQLRSQNYGIIALFYKTTFSSAPELPGTLVLSPSGSSANRRLLRLVGANSGELGLHALTLALEKDPDYHLQAQGRYDSAHDYGIYAIWQKVQT
jgi:hypothetical protein